MKLPLHAVEVISFSAFKIQDDADSLKRFKMKTGVDSPGCNS
jgi:hypothetical protein